MAKKDIKYFYDDKNRAIQQLVYNRGLNISTAIKTYDYFKYCKIEWIIRDLLYSKQYGIPKLKIYAEEEGYTNEHYLFN